MRTATLGEELLSLRIARLDVLLELDVLHTPLAAATHLDGLELAAADEGVCLCRTDLELLAYVRERQETRHGNIVPAFWTLEPVIHSLMLFGAV